MFSWLVVVFQYVLRCDAAVINEQRSELLDAGPAASAAVVTPGGLVGVELQYVHAALLWALEALQYALLLRGRALGVSDLPALGVILAVLECAHRKLDCAGTVASLGRR